MDADFAPLAYNLNDYFISTSDNLTYSVSPDFQDSIEVQISFPSTFNFFKFNKITDW